MKKLVAALLSGAALAVTVAPAAQAKQWVVKPGGSLDPLQPIPCICLPEPDLA